MCQLIQQHPWHRILTLRHVLVEQYPADPWPCTSSECSAYPQEKGNKAGAVKGYQLLEQEGLGELIEMNPQRGTSVVCPYLLTYNTQCVLESYACMVSVFLVVCTKAYIVYRR